MHRDCRCRALTCVDSESYIFIEFTATNKKAGAPVKATGTTRLKRILNPQRKLISGFRVLSCP